MLDLYKNIHDRRIALGMTQSELAAKTGYSDKGMISRIEKGRVDLPVSKIEIFATALHTDPILLMGNSWDQASEAFKLSASEESLLSDFRQLNDDGQDRVCGYTSDLVASGRYDRDRGIHCGSGSGQDETA